MIARKPLPTKSKGTTLQSHVNINVRAEWLTEFEATYQEGSEPINPTFLGSDTK